MTMTRLRRAMLVFVASVALCASAIPAIADEEGQLAAIADMATTIFWAVRTQDLPTQDLRDAAYGAAIGQVMTDAVARYGQDAAERAASVVIVLAAQFHISSAALGRALAQYAAVAPGGAALATARAVADEGETLTTQAFGETVRAGGADSLAHIAGGPAAVSGVLSPTPNAHPGIRNYSTGTYTGGGVPGGTLGFQALPTPCPYPSCS